MLVGALVGSPPVLGVVALVGTLVRFTPVLDVLLGIGVLVGILVGSTPVLGVGVLVGILVGSTPVLGVGALVGKSVGETPVLDVGALVGTLVGSTPVLCVLLADPVVGSVVLIGVDVTVLVGATGGTRVEEPVSGGDLVGISVGIAELVDNVLEIISVDGVLMPG